MNDKDSKLLWEAYTDVPPQCPSHLLEEGLSHQLHSWVLTKALPWLQKNKGKVAAAGGLAAALAMYMGMDPDTAQSAVDGMDPEISDQFSAAQDFIANAPVSSIPFGSGEDMKNYLLSSDFPNPIAGVSQKYMHAVQAAQADPALAGAGWELELAQARLDAFIELQDQDGGNSLNLDAHMRAARAAVEDAMRN